MSFKKEVIFNPKTLKPAAWNKNESVWAQSITTQRRWNPVDASFKDCSCIPSLSELSDGWAINFSEKTNQPVTQKVIENYSIKSSNITCLQKMACYRQSINFDRKNIYKIMANKITDEYCITFGQNLMHQWKKKFPPSNE